MTLAWFGLSAVGALKTLSLFQRNVCAVTSALPWRVFLHTFATASPKDQICAGCNPLVTCHGEVLPRMRNEGVRFHRSISADVATVQNESGENFIWINGGIHSEGNHAAYTRRSTATIA